MSTYESAHKSKNTPPTVCLLIFVSLFLVGCQKEPKSSPPQHRDAPIEESARPSPEQETQNDEASKSVNLNPRGVIDWEENTAQNLRSAIAQQSIILIDGTLTRIFYHTGDFRQSKVVSDRLKKAGIKCFFVDSDMDQDFFYGVLIPLIRSDWIENHPDTNDPDVNSMFLDLRRRRCFPIKDEAEAAVLSVLDKLLD
ncbi:MAG: hypothetical protein R3C03_21970 [Pirellulaceae bacterium]